MTKPDWIAIEGEYRAGQRSLRDIADEHGITEGAIRHRAKKNGWVRNPSEVVREKVKAHFSGIGTTQDATQYALRKIDEAVSSSIAYLEKGEANAARILDRVAEMLEVVSDPKDLKTLNDANAGAIDTIRRIRQLDDPTERMAGITVRYVG